MVKTHHKAALGDVCHQDKKATLKANHTGEEVVSKNRCPRVEIRLAPPDYPNNLSSTTCGVSTRHNREMSREQGPLVCMLCLQLYMISICGNIGNMTANCRGLVVQLELAGHRLI